MTITLSYPPIRDLLEEPEFTGFRKTLSAPIYSMAVGLFFGAVDRIDVAAEMILLTPYGIPAIVPPLTILEGNRKFAEAVLRNDTLKKALGIVTKVRARTLGLVPTGRKARIGYWVTGFTVGEVYRVTGAVWDTITFKPPLPKGKTVLDVSYRPLGAGGGR